MPNLLDWYLRPFISHCDLPDIPAVRRLARAAYWDGLLLGTRRRHVEEMRQEALRALVAYQLLEAPDA